MIMKKAFYTSFFAAFMLFTMAVPAQAQLQSGVFNKFFEDTFSETYDTNQGQDLEKTLPQAVGRIINVLLGFVGVILLVLIVYAGFLWLTAGGNEDQVAKAKKLIQNGVIGMAIILSAFIITTFVVSQLSKAIDTGGSTTQTSTP